MSIIIQRRTPEPPYSLHDAHILELRPEGENTLRLVSQTGYVRTAPPYEQVDGDVAVTGVDWESSYLYLLAYQDVLCGNCGQFAGEKRTVEAFLRKNPRFSMDIMDETYGYCQMKLNGFLSLEGQCLEFFLELYYTGEVRYLLKE